MLNLNKLLANDKLSIEYAAYFLSFAEIDNDPQSKNFTHLSGGLENLIAGNRRNLDDLKVRSWLLDQTAITFIKLAYSRLILKYADSPNLIHRVMTNDLPELFDINLNDAAERVINHLRLDQSFELFISEGSYK